MSEKVSLASISVDLSDGLHAAPKFKPDGEYLFINANNMVDGRLCDIGNGKKADIEEYEKYKIELDDNTLFYSIDGTIGNVAKYHGEKVILGKGACYIRLKPEVCRDYIYYLLKSNMFAAYIKTMQTGSTIHHISLETMRKFSFDLPERSVQEALVNLPISIDEKISNNTAICSNLESMAKLLYNFWFVQFDFPDENGKPYKSSGGKMVWNDELKREIPEGWTVGTLHNLSNVVWGQCPEGKDILDKSIQDEDLLDYCSGAGDMRNGFIVDCQAKTYKHTSRRMAHKNAILLSVAGSIGAICVADHDISLGRAAVAFEAETPVYNMFIVNVLQMLSNQVQRIATGSIQKVINGDHIESMKFSYEKNVLLAYGKKTMPIYEKLLVISSENQQLASLRDFLLPMLMNGQVNVGKEGA